MNQTLDVRDTLVWLADEPTKPNPQSKAAPSQSALRPFGAGVCGGVCRFAAAIADAGVCARTRAAVKGCPAESSSSAKRLRLHSLYRREEYLCASLLTGIRFGFILRTLGRGPKDGAAPAKE